MPPKRGRISRTDMETAPRGKSISFAYGSVRAVFITPPQVAVVAAKKIFKTSVRRNRIRRRIRTLLTRALHEGTLSQSIIVFPNVSAEKASFTELESALRPLFSLVSSATMRR